MLFSEVTLLFTSISMHAYTFIKALCDFINENYYRSKTYLLIYCTCFI